MQPQQQSIERVDQGRNLGREPLRRQRRQAVYVTLLNFGGDTAQGPQPVADHATIAAPRSGKSKRSGITTRNAAPARKGRANSQRLRDLDHPVQRLQTVGAP